MPAKRTTPASPSRTRGIPAWLALSAAAVVVGWGLVTAARYGRPLDVLHALAFRSACVGLGLGVVSIVALAARWLRPPGFASAGSGFGPLRALVAWLLLGGIVVLAAFQPPRRPVVSLSLALAASLWAATILLASRGRRTSRILSLLDLGFVGVLTVALTAEASLRIAERVTRSPLLLRSGGSAAETLALRRAEPGHENFGFPVNSRADYDTEPPAPDDDVPLVVCIGDSFSASIVPHSRHFTTVAERAFTSKTGSPIEIYNMGTHAIGPDEYLLLLETEALPLRPDLIVIDLFVGNDLTAAREHDELQAGWITGFEVDTWLVSRVLGRLGPLLGEVGSHADPSAAPGEPTSARHTLRRGDPEVGVRAEEAPRLFPWIDDVEQEIPFFSAPRFAEIETDRARGVCSPTTRPYERTFSVLTEMLTAAGDTPLAVMILPDEFQVEDAVWDEVLALSRDEPLLRDQPQMLLLPWLAAHGIPTLDLLPVLRDEPAFADGRKHLYHLRDSHFNARGNERTGQALAAFIEAVLRH